MTAQPQSKSRIFTTEDARARARRRLPRLVWDFLDGGIGREAAQTANLTAFDAIKLQPRVLRDVARRDLSTTLLGRSFDLPFGISPMGMCNLTHPLADSTLAGIAARANIPACQSTAASTKLETFRAMAPENTWFQLYVGQSHDEGLALAARAGKAGYETLVLTVDVPCVSPRARDLRNGFQVPFRIGPRQALDFALHPFWSVPMALHALRNGLPSPANFDLSAGKSFDRHAPRAGANWEFLDRLRAAWPGTLIVKGVMEPSDASRISMAGADALWVSNHGGRQLDSAPAAIEQLPDIRAAVDVDTPILFCSGVRNGEDIVKALALGADFVMLGRPWMYALGAEGPRGANALLDILTKEIDSTMAQIGVTAIPEITKECLAAKGDP